MKVIGNLIIRFLVKRSDEWQAKVDRKEVSDPEVRLNEESHLQFASSRFKVIAFCLYTLTMGLILDKNVVSSRTGL